MSKKPYQFSARIRQILVSLSRVLADVPPDLSIIGQEEELLERCLKLIREFQPVFRFLFILGLHLFDRIPFLFGFGPRRFVHLKPEQQKRYVQKWLSSRSFLIRDLILSIRGFVIVCVCSHHDIWRYIGYDPKSHAEERIRLRHELLKKTGRQGDLGPVKQAKAE